MNHTMAIQLNTQFWKEGDMYVAHIPQLHLASCGETLEEARKNIRDASEGFFEATDKMGTTKDVLEEAGFSFDKEWKAPEILSLERMSLAV